MKNNKTQFFNILRKPTHFIAFGFGSGCMPLAPGTFGSLMALPFYWIFFQGISTPMYAVLLLITFFIGCWVSDITGRDLGDVDHSGIVIDEMVGMWIVLYDLPQGYLWPWIAFALFRLFDITKPFPIRQLEQRYNNGFGVMIDDVMAAIYAAASWRLLTYFFL